MPRKSNRGGAIAPDARAVAPSGPGAQSRRTDLGKPQAVTTPTGLPYGEAGQLAQAQQLMAVPNQQAQPSPGAAQGPPTPLRPGPLTGPTQRPGEHVMTPPAGVAG